MPLVIHVLRCVVRNQVTFLHNLSAAIATLLILGGKLTIFVLMLPISLPLLFATAFAVGLILAIVGARFRDMGPVIAMAVQLIFFMTPTMWRPEDLPNASKWWVTANPAYHLIEMVRAPLLGTMPSPLSCAVSVATATLLTLGATLLYRRFRRRIFYWL